MPDTTRSFREVDAALAYLTALYNDQAQYLRRCFQRFADGHDRHSSERYRGYYPFVRVSVRQFSPPDTMLASYGFVDGPGIYQTTVTRIDLFNRYLRHQLSLLLAHHREALEVGLSDVPMPVHFAFADGLHVEGKLVPDDLRLLRERFDVPDLDHIDDRIVNGDYIPAEGEPQPLALFTAPRIDYSLHRLRHYTGTHCEHFQNYVLFTNYAFYVDGFLRYARELMAGDGGGYLRLVEPGGIVTEPGQSPTGQTLKRQPQMPAYHLVGQKHSGITLVNIGVGPSNAKTITDHIAVLRPHAWLMLGHCAGLRKTQKLGDYVLAHGYVREDHVLDADLPTWVPIPALAEVQVALQEAVREVTTLSGRDLKLIMRTGTVASIDNRNWELRQQREPVQRFSQSRAIALDMESATIAANGFRFRVPYGTLLCVSDKPLHGEIKLPGMADEFYQTQIQQHLKIGVLALEKLRQLPAEQLHSRKLRSFNEVAFQ